MSMRPNIGNFIRLALVIAWLALFIPHVVHHVAPGLGLSQRGNAETLLSVNLGREFHYDIVRGNTSGRLGTCRMSFMRVEKGFESETELHFSDLNSIAPGIALLPQMREQSVRAVRLQLTELLDAQQHLLSLTANGLAFGKELTAEGTIAADGLHGTYSFDHAESVPFHLPEVGQDAGHGSDLAMNLPPGLKPGDRFTTRLLTPDIAHMKLSAITAFFNAIALEKCATVAGERSLLKVDMQVDDRLMSTLWCDENGVVYRSRQQNGSMEMQLTQIRMIGGDILWPPESATK